MSEDPGPMRGSAASDDRPTQRFRSYGQPTRQQATLPEPGRHAARRRTQVTPAHPPAEPAPPYEALPHQALPHQALPYEALPYETPPYETPPHQTPPHQAPPPGVQPAQTQLHQAQPHQAQPHRTRQQQTRQQQPTAPAAEPAPDDIVRYGPGVPGSPHRAAETAWRGDRPPQPSRRRVRLRRLLGMRSS